MMKNRKATHILASSIAALLVATTLPSQAATLTWDNGAATGNWNTTDANFTGLWTDGNSALFGGAASSTVALTAPISATGLAFNVTGDIINGSAINNLTLAGGHNISVGSGLAATIGAPLAGTEGVTVLGGGLLTRSTAITDTYTGGTTVSGAGTVLSYSATINSTTSAPSLTNGNILIDAGQLKLGAPGTTQDLYFGNTSTPNSLTVQNGGSIGGSALTLGTLNSGSFRALFIGNGASSNGNSVLVTGAGSFIANNSANDSYVTVGKDSSNNTLNVEAGAIFQSFKGNGGSGLNIGQNAGANNNVVTVTGAGSTLYASNQPTYVGGAGNSNGLVASNGGYFKIQRLYMGGTGGDNNYVNITGTGAAHSANGYIAASTNSILSVGEVSGATGNTVTVSAGGALVIEGGQGNRRNSIGGVAGASGNSITVTGTNSSMSINFFNAFGIGRDTSTGNAGGGNSNSFNLSNGAALVSTGGVVVGNDVTSPTPTGGAFNLGNGGASTATATLGASFAQYTASAGTVPIAGGSTVTAFATATSANTWINLFSAGTTLNINNGRLITGDNVVTGSTLVGGAGSVALDGPAYLSVTAGAQNIATTISGIGSFTKEGAGSLSLSGSNTYSGDTSVLAGTLSIAAASLSDLADVYLSAGSTFNLGYASTDIIDSFFIDGVAQDTGIWGALGSGAAHQTSLLTGTGTLTVTTSAVPEPTSIALAAMGSLGILALRRRRSSGV